MINFAIVGAGHIAMKHIEAIEKSEGAKLVAICDTDPKRLNNFDKNIKTYTDINEMLSRNEDISVVNICTPSGLHAQLTTIVATYGCHIIVEKPMALKISDSEEMIRVSQEHGVKLAVVHPNRFRPAIQLLKNKMEQGVFGKLSHANCTVRWNRNQDYYDQASWRGTKEFDGGVLMNQAIHNLDLLLWLMGPVESVQAMVATRLRKIETEDVATSVVRFKNGALGIIEAATTIYPKNLEESIAIFGETGTVKIGGTNANFIQVWDIKGDLEEESKIIASEINKDPFGKPGHQFIIEDMVDAIIEDRDPIINGEDGIAPIKLISAIIESSIKGNQVLL